MTINFAIALPPRPEDVDRSGNDCHDQDKDCMLNGFNALEIQLHALSLSVHI
jgi:hypothetical protein